MLCTYLPPPTSSSLLPPLQFSGDITYNGEGFDSFQVARTCAYISQVDEHQAELTVRETFDFAARCLGVGHKQGEKRELVGAGVLCIWAGACVDAAVPGQLATVAFSAGSAPLSQASAELLPCKHFFAQISFKCSSPSLPPALSHPPPAVYVDELRRREKELGIEPDAEVDAFLKAEAVEGKRSNIVTDLMLRVLGLEVLRDGGGVCGGQ